MITPQNVLRHELIGLAAEVVRASNGTYCGVSGVITDETRNMLVIRTARGVKNVPKNACIIRLALPGGSIVEVEGSALVAAPEKRISIRPRR
ncbi:MAG: ribonuclease P protein subunit [Methanomicrobiales archaeon]|nr:ribonuclease P protein subunit [Methanomicrobiales archaeon]